MKKFVLPLATLVVAGITLASCGGGSQDLRPVKGFIGGEYVQEEVAAYGTTFKYYYSYNVNFYDGSVYELVVNKTTEAFSRILGGETVVTYGTYVTGAVEDGVASYTLNKAAEVVLSSYASGQFNIVIDTSSTSQTYPAEMPASGQGEKPMANSKADVINKYGLGSVIYTTNNVLSFVDPNGDGTSSKGTVNAESGSVSGVLKKQIKKVQTLTFKEGEGIIKVKALNLFVFEDNSFEYFDTALSYGYGRVLGVTSVTNYGSGVYGTGEDGYTPFTMQKASSSILNFYSVAGANITINTNDANQTYPTEMPAQTEGEKPMANNQDEYLAVYGPQKTVYTSDETNVMSLTNPNE